MTKSRAAHLAQFSDEHLAYHEAGHAVLHHLQGGIVTRLSIERSDPQQGTHVGPKPEPAEWLPTRSRRSGRWWPCWWRARWRRRFRARRRSWWRRAARSTGSRRCAPAAGAGLDGAAGQAMIEEEWRRVQVRLEEPESWSLVEAAAQALLREKTLVADLFRTTISR